MKREIINPQMKIGELLSRYPELEEVLISITPVFSKLKNPVLRRTIARVATLQQAALTANVPVHEIVNRLRLAAGQKPEEEGPAGGFTELSPEAGPAWMLHAVSRIEFDARPVLASGAHPLHEVFQRLKLLPTGAVLDVITSFYPAPLVDTLHMKGWVTHHSQRGDDLFVTTIGREQSD